MTDVGTRKKKRSFLWTATLWGVGLETLSQLLNIGRLVEMARTWPTPSFVGALAGEYGGAILFVAAIMLLARGIKWVARRNSK